jgi:hypothetical protein
MKNEKYEIGLFIFHLPAFVDFRVPSAYTAEIAERTGSG